MAEDSRKIITTKRQIHVIFNNQPSKHAKADDPATAPAAPAAAAKTEPPLENEQKYKEALRELNELIGLECVKELMEQIYALLKVRGFREETGLKCEPHVYHMIFKGNPGTGKTTVARIVAKLFKAMGVLDKGHFMEVERADLVGEYIGHTALKTREVVKKALGGVLFIDEVYSLARGGEKDFGKECIDCLVKSMEDHRSEFILIIAGYTDEMEEFLRTNPGLPSRFPIKIEFPDYTVDELMLITEKMASERDYAFTPLSLSKLKEHYADVKKKVRRFSNARFVRNLLEKAIRLQAVRLTSVFTEKPGKQELMLLRPEDLRLDAASEREPLFEYHSSAIGE